MARRQLNAYKRASKKKGPGMACSKNSKESYIIETILQIQRRKTVLVKPKLREFILKRPTLTRNKGNPLS